MATSAVTPGRAEVQRLVEEIASEHSHLPEHVLRTMTRETRTAVERALLRKDRIIGSSVVTLAQNLYTSNARFVFELLQNADDNKYSRSRARGVAPFVSFKIYPRRIVVENNEDGFEPENLTAICSVGQSLKTGSSAYIGEKGIEFKSVFISSWKAHVQSGSFSFYFQHRRGDSGMGMISPIWQRPEQDLDSKLTRITLDLHESGDPIALNTEREAINEQFRNLQDTVLLSLRNIKRINIKSYDADDNVLSSIEYSIHAGEAESTVALKKVIIEDHRVDELKNYYVVKHVAENLERSENRIYTADDDTTRSYAKADVTLAFPLKIDSLTSDLIPVVEPQEVFAFLPVRHMGFKFLIQSDFVTQANRQDIVITSAMNLSLLNGIADAFIKAVRRFCYHRHPYLQYQWMRYLPNPDSFPWDSFWRRLVDKIKDRLERVAVLRPRSERSLRRIRDLRRYDDYASDQAGEPLFNDMEPEAYLSCIYREEDLDILSPHGLAFMSIDDYIRRVISDLSSPSSKMKWPGTDSDWHSRAAKLLLTPFNENNNYLIDWLRAIELLPLENQRWVSAHRGHVYYAESGRIPFPRDLGFDMIDPLASENDDRKALFNGLGVQELPTSFVRDVIIKNHEEVINGDNFDLNRSRRHLEYLYLTHQTQESEPFQLRSIHVYCQNGALGMPHTTDFYLSNNEQYGARELLRETELGMEPGAGAPGLPVCFLHPQYFEDTPQILERHNLRWKEWLYKHVRIRQHLRLTFHDSFTRLTHLSDVCLYLANYRPERFLGVLKHYWRFEGSSIAESPSATSILRITRVLCEENRMVELSDTYLPIPSLRRRCATFMNETRLFPFLMLETPLRQENYRAEWEFLHTNFGVGIHCNIDFYLAILAAIFESNHPADTLNQSSRVYELYEAIQAQYLESDDRNSQRSKIRDFFDRKECVLIPAHRMQEATWVSRSQCLWLAPLYMQTKYPLISLYSGYFGRPDTDSRTLSQFFETTLDVPNVAWRNYVDEIKNIRSYSSTEFDLIGVLYSCLDQLISDGLDDEGELKQAFEDDALIYVFANGEHNWYTVSQCLWASNTTIRGKVTLNDHYENLRDFFISFLGVAELDFAMVLEKLVESTGQESVAETKDTLWILNSMLQGQNILQSPEPILGSSIFPVRSPNGQVELGTSRTDFGIVDRRKLGDAFFNQAKLLDFTLDEVHRLKPFFRWTGLENRYLSMVVKEVSRLQGGDLTLISTQDRDIRRKARGLFRVAAHYGSPRTQENNQSLYHLLRNSSVYETDGILSTLVLSQDGSELTFEVDRSELHICEDDSGLKIYVPRDTRSQDFCYCSKLPPKLLNWMMTDNNTLSEVTVEPAAVLVASKVINAKQSTVDLILEEEGIIEVEIFNDDYSEENAEGLCEQASQPSLRLESGGDGETSRQQTPSSSVATESSPQGNRVAIGQEVLHVNSPSSIVSSRLNGQLTYTQPHNVPIHGPLYSAQNFDVNGIEVDRDANYRGLLTRTIMAARRSVFPSNGPLNRTALINVLPNTDISSRNSMERDKKIGAAGELFVFEVLSQLIPSLPKFSRDNWQSTIRRYVSVHPEYANMAGWNRRETADIVYEDCDGLLTELMIDNGYLARDQWEGSRPEYFIEVKSTVGRRDTLFHMSKHQYQIMRDSSNGVSGLTNQNRIYVVFRVFNLFHDSVDMQLYMDPETLRQRGELLFTADNWTVVPAAFLN